MTLHEIACSIVQEYVLAQLADPDSELWLAVEDDPDYNDLTIEEQDGVLKAVHNVKVTIH